MLCNWLWFMERGCPHHCTVPNSTFKKKSWITFYMECIIATSSTQPPWLVLKTTLHWTPSITRPVLSGSRPLRRPSSTSSLGRFDDLLAAAATASKEATNICARVYLLILGSVIPPLIGNLFTGYMNPYYWVDDYPLLYGNNESSIYGFAGSFFGGGGDFFVYIQ